MAVKGSISEAWNRDRRAVKGSISEAWNRDHRAVKGSISEAWNRDRRAVKGSVSKPEKKLNRSQRGKRKCIYKVKELGPPAPEVINYTLLLTHFRLQRWVNVCACAHIYMLCMLHLLPEIVPFYFLPSWLISLRLFPVLSHHKATYVRQLIQHFPAVWNVLLLPDITADSLGMSSIKIDL